MQNTKATTYFPRWGSESSGEHGSEEAQSLGGLPTMPPQRNLTLRFASTSGVESLPVASRASLRYDPARRAHAQMGPCRPQRRELTSPAGRLEPVCTGHFARRVSDPAQDIVVRGAEQ